MFTLYGFPKSRSTRVAWMLEELGVDYRFVKVDFAATTGPGAEFRRHNPSGKVPVLCEDEFCLSESGAIITHLGDRFAESELTPAPGSLDYARYLQWAFFVLTELEQPLWTLAKHKFALPEERRVPEIAPTATWEFQRAAATLASGINPSGHLVGEDFTAADLLAAHTLGWALAARVELPEPALADYARRHLARSAFARAREREGGA